jgi:phage gp36-like protein
MSYATRAQLIARLTPKTAQQLTRQSDEGPLYTAALDAALAWAYGQINSYLAVRYKVPIGAAYADAVAMLAQAELTLAEWQLWSSHGAVMAEGVKAKHDTTIAWLRDVAAGKAAIPAETVPTEAPAAGNVSASVVGAARVMSRAELDGF